MKKIFLLCLIALSLSSYAQPQKKGLNQTMGVYFDTIVIPQEKNADCYVTYQIIYNRLVFTKDKDIFTARFNLSIEAVDSLTGKVFREIVKNEHSVYNFEETNADNKYIQGVVKLSLPQGAYNIQPLIFDVNTGSEHVLLPFALSVNTPAPKGIMAPIVLKGKEGDSSKELAGFDGNVPFSMEPYNLIIPVMDTSLTSVYLEMRNNDTIVFKGEIRNSFTGAISLEQNAQSIAVGFNSRGVKTRNFILPDFNQKLQEGELSMSVTAGPKEKAAFQRSVVWYNKPRSLNNFEYAVKVLKNIESETEINRLSKYTDRTGYNELTHYWKKYDPTPETAYNELMAEFYERVDYAVNSFSLISNRDGADTDRGRVYIKFGKPKSVERIYQDSKDVREVWMYDSPERKFIFVDKSGLGNFILSGKL